MDKWENQSAKNMLALLTAQEYCSRKKALERFCIECNKAEIRYALSCSTALFLQGIVDDFGDLDVLIHMDDVNKLKEILNSIGVEWVPTIQKAAFMSPYYQEATLYGVHMDIVGDITVATYNKKYCYQLSLDECQHAELEGGVDVPIISAEANLLLYAMMEGWQSKRCFKRNLCQEFLLKKGISYEGVFERAKKAGQLPQWIINLINEIMGVE